MSRRFSSIDTHTITCLNVLLLLNIHSSMTFDELLDELSNAGYFIYVRLLEKDLRMIVEEGLIVLKLDDVYYITENGAKFLKYYPNWRIKRRKVQQTKPVIF